MMMISRRRHGPNPYAVLRRDETEVTRVAASTVTAVGVKELDIIENLTAARVAGLAAAVGAVCPYPFRAAAAAPDHLHAGQGTCAAAVAIGPPGLVSRPS